MPRAEFHISKFISDVLVIIYWIFQANTGLCGASETENIPVSFEMGNINDMSRVAVHHAIRNRSISECDFHVVNTKVEYELSLELQFARDNNIPLLLKDVFKDWPSVDSFLEKFGDYSVKKGSESSIVFSNGESYEKIKISSLLNAVSEGNNIDQINSGLFSFDTEIIKSRPDILDVFPIPSFLFLFHNSSSTANGLIYPVLSIAGIKSGE